MDESLIDLFKKFDNESIDDIRENIRTKIYKELNEHRKKDYEFKKILEEEESKLFNSLIFFHKKFNSNLKNLIKKYDCLVDLKFATDRFKRNMENIV